MIEFIQNIPLLLVYFVPGAVTVLLYRRLMEHEQNDNTLILYGVIISGLIKGTIDIITSEAHSLVCYTVIGLVIAIIAYKFITSHIAQVIAGRLNVTPTTNVLLNTIDLKGGTILVVHLKNGNAVNGHIDTIDQRWITLWEYSLCDPHYEEGIETNKQGLLCIPISEVEYFETAYDDDNTPIMRRYRKTDEV